MKATWRHVSAPSPRVLSYDIPLNTSPSSGMPFHSLQATSHALQPMHTLVSVKNPTRCASSGVSSQPQLTSHPPPGVVGDPRARLIRRDELDASPATRSTARTDVAREGLHLLDVHVGIEPEVHQLVGGVAGAEAVRPPVIGQT